MESQCTIWTKQTMVFISILLLTACLGKAQKEICTLKPEESVWAPEYGDKSETEFLGSSVLIFQKDFNDSIRVSTTNEVLFEDWIVTDPRKGLSLKTVEIDHSELGEGKVVQIELAEENTCISFSLRDGYTYVYISKHNLKWFVEFSKYRRKYY